MSDICPKCRKSIFRKDKQQKKNNNLFIVRTFSLKKVVDEDLNIEYEVFKIKYKAWKNKTFEEFLSWHKDFHKNPYDIESEDFAYFETKEEAADSILRNQADMNDGGAYKYASIVEVPYKVSYPNSMYVQSVTLYRFNKKTEKFEIIDMETDEETRAIKNIFSIVKKIR